MDGGGGGCVNLEMTPETPKEIAVRNQRMFVSDIWSELPVRGEINSMMGGGGREGGGR